MGMGMEPGVACDLPLALPDYPLDMVSSFRLSSGLMSQVCYAYGCLWDEDTLTESDRSRRTMEALSSRCERATQHSTHKCLRRKDHGCSSLHASLSSVRSPNQAPLCAIHFGAGNEARADAAWQPYQRNIPIKEYACRYGCVYEGSCKGGHFWTLQTCAILSRHFQKLICLFGGRGSTLETFTVIFRGRRNTLDVRNTFASLPEDEFHFSWRAQHFGDLHGHLSWQGQYFRRVVLRVFANRIVRAASSGDNVQIVWQACDIVSYDFVWQAQHLVQEKEEVEDEGEKEEEEQEEEEEDREGEEENEG
eukprot:s1340_g9.t1